MQKLILFPLTILILLSLLSMTGLGNSDQFTGVGSISYGDQAGLLYDSTGHPVCYINGTQYDDAGMIKYTREFGYLGEESPRWQNYSGITASYYDLYSSEAAIEPLTTAQYNELKNAYANGGISFDIWSSLGLIGVVVGISAFAAIIGIRVLDSGESETTIQTILTVTGFMAVWGIFSVLGLALFTSAGTYGGIIYFVLTAMYSIGIIFQLSGGNSN